MKVQAQALFPCQYQSSGLGLVSEAFLCLPIWTVVRSGVGALKARLHTVMFRLLPPTLRAFPPNDWPGSSKPCVKGRAGSRIPYVSTGHRSG
eukprot:1240163-Rhodomonas_salina.2